MFKRLLAATEMVDFCDAPVITALRIAKQNNSQLSILHVLESESTRDRRLVKRFRTGEETVTGAEYEKIVREEICESCSELMGPYRRGPKSRV